MALLFRLIVDDVETRMMSNYTLKRELAEFSASLVRTGRNHLYRKWQQQCPARPDSGQTKKNVTIITVSSYIAHLLKDAPCEVILLGGVYKKSESMVGPLTRQCIRNRCISAKHLLVLMAGNLKLDLPVAI